MKRLISIFFLSFLNCPGLSFAIPHSQHVSSNLECADRRKAYFLSLDFHKDTENGPKTLVHISAMFISKFSLEEFVILWLTHSPISPPHVLMHELGCLRKKRVQIVQIACIVLVTPLSLNKQILCRFIEKLSPTKTF